MGENKPIKGIIAGTGRAGTYLHFGPFKAAGADIVAFVDTNIDAARSASEKYGVPYYYPSLDEALSHHKVDFVSVCTPPQTHYEIARVSLEHGCHILVEKPLTYTMDEADKLNEARLKANRAICVVHNHKFFPGIVKAKELADGGVIGDIIHIHREMSFTYENVRMMEPGHWAHEVPGGRLMEANPHNLYLIYNFIGPMKLEYIYPRKVTERWPHAIIDEFTALFSTASAMATVRMSLRATAAGYGRHGPNFLVLTGTKGVLLVDYHRCKLIDEALSKPVTRIFSADALVSKSRAALSLIVDLAKAKRTRDEITNAGVNSGHKAFIERFVGYLTGRYSELPTSWEEGYTVQKLNDEMGVEIDKIMDGRDSYPVSSAKE